MHSATVYVSESLYILEKSKCLVYVVSTYMAYSV